MAGFSPPAEPSGAVEESGWLLSAPSGGALYPLELYPVLVRVDDAPFKFEVHGRCGYASTFDYRSDPVAGAA